MTTDEAVSREAVAFERLVAYLAMNPSGYGSGPLADAVEEARRGAIVAEASEEAQQRRTQAHEEAVAAAVARVAEEAEFRATCAAKLEAAEYTAVAALLAWLSALLGSGQVPLATARNPATWLGILERATGIDVAGEALRRVRTRDL